MHSVDLDISTAEQKEGTPLAINFICPTLARMYLVRSYAVDTRSALLQIKSLNNQSLKQSFQNRFGIEDFDNKLKRFIELDLNLLGVPEEYYAPYHKTWTPSLKTLLPQDLLTQPIVEVFYNT